MKDNIENKYYLPPNSNLDLDLDSDFEQLFLWKRAFFLILTYELLEIFCIITVNLVEINFFQKNYFGSAAVYVSRVLIFMFIASIQRTNKIKYFGLLALYSWVVSMLISYEPGYPLLRFFYILFTLVACAAIGGFIGDKIFKPKLT